MQHPLPPPTAVVEGHTGVMTRDEVLAICLNLPAAEETYPLGEDVAAIQVGARCSRWCRSTRSPGPSTSSVILHGRSSCARRSPESGPATTKQAALEHRDPLDGSVEDDVVRGLIADSYELVVAAAAFGPCRADERLSVEVRGGMTRLNDAAVVGCPSADHTLAVDIGGCQDRKRLAAAVRRVSRSRGGPRIPRTTEPRLGH
jgi:hypothetical protein